MAEGWKIYWRTPGDSGLPPTFDWTGSQNLQSHTVKWPVPYRFTMYDIDNIGYNGDMEKVLRDEAEKKKPAIIIGDGSIDGLFSEFLATLGAALDLPLFDGGRRRAEVAAARAELDASLAEYRQAFLEALGEAETALVAITAYRARAGSLSEAIEQSETALGQSNALYREGLASLFDVLDAQRQLISSRESLLDNEAALANAFIALHSAAASPDGEAVAASAGGAPPPQ